MRVLLIEDEPTTAKAIELMLTTEGFNVYTTDLGEEGLDLGKLYDYDIILLDLNLPDMHGYDVLKKLRVARVSTPVLILSGVNEMDSKVRSFGFGADDYVTKPFHREELVARIHAVVRRSKGHSQSVIRTGKLAVNLQHAGHCAIRAYNAEQAQNLISDVLPDLVLLDWMLPGKSGIAFARELRDNERTKHIPIIMLTARGDEQDKVLGLEIGADDYVTKPFSPKELMARIKAVLRRRAPQLTEDVVSINGLRLDPATHRVAASAEGNEIKLDLGPTEFRLLHFFMTHPERVHSRTQLLDQVWGDHVFVEERTVDVHIKRLRAALKPAGCDAMIETVRGSGYRLAKHA